MYLSQTTFPYKSITINMGLHKIKRRSSEDQSEEEEKSINQEVFLSGVIRKSFITQEVFLFIDDL